MKQGKCRHMLSGRVSYSLCSYGYNCEKCPYDQMIEDTSFLPNLKPARCGKLSHFMQTDLDDAPIGGLRVIACNSTK
jgi:hypothetical protein